MRILGRSGSALRWVATLTEPLLTTNQRIRFEKEFLEVARVEPLWFCAYTAGVLSGITSSLPMTDPWRTVRIEVDGIPRWPDGSQFGSRRDTDDILRPIQGIDDAGVDATTLALEEEISSDEAALLVQSFDGWRRAYEALVTISGRDSPDIVFNQATNTIRWAEHRRRAYRPEIFDVWLDFLALHWANWADEVRNDRPSDFIDSEIEPGLRREREALAKVAKDLEFFN
jgi:hypothetical protein